MPVDDDLLPIMEEIDVLMHELRDLRQRGPCFRIYHRFHRTGTVCAPGEEIAVVCLVYRGREFPLRLSLSLRILFDYLARHNRFPQNASQIEVGIRADPFFATHQTFTASNKPHAASPAHASGCTWQGSALPLPKH